MSDYYIDKDGKLKKKKAKSKMDEKGKIVSIAPSAKKNEEKEKKETTQSEKRTYFKKSEGNLWDTILGSSGDLGENISKGAVGLAETFWDGLTAITPAMYQMEMADAGQIVPVDEVEQMKKEAGEMIKKDLINEDKIIDESLGKFNKNLGIDTDKNSVFGEKSDSLAQSGGQLLAQIALSPVVPWYITTGFSSLGGQTESALKSGADYDLAVGSGIVSATADILTEKLFGGSGLGEKGLINVEKLTQGITHKAFKTALDYGIDIVGEGGEEVFAGIISNLGTALYEEKNLSEILASEEAVDGYIESFIGGAVLGGGANSVKAVKSAVKGTDYRTGVTANEQKILDKAVEQRIEEAEKSGKKLTKAEKTEIEQDVLNSLKRGEIDLDTIEREFGGESYSALDSLKKEADEFNTLYETPGEKLSEKQKDRLAELKAKNTENSYENRLFEAQDKLTQDVQKATEHDGYIREVYGEKAKKSEAFKVSEEEAKKYSEQEMELVNKAVESGIINNTRKSHDLVGLLAKLHKDKGVNFDFANNEKLKESGFAINGKTIDGFKQGDNITINLQSNKALNTVVGHEITHVLEGTDMYQALQDTVIEYAKAQGVYDAKYKDIVHLYRTQFQDNDLQKRKALYDGEITADLVGEYIFSDMDFVRNLSTKNPNVFQKVFNEIKYMLKVATAGSDAEKQLLKAKKIFEDVYRDTTRNTNEEVQFSISETSSGRKYVDVDKDQTLFDGLDTSNKRAMAKLVIQEYFPAGTQIDLDGDVFYVSNRTPKEYAYAEKNRGKKRLQEDKMRASVELDNLIEVSNFVENVPFDEVKTKHPEAIGGIDLYETIFKVQDRWYKGIVNIINRADGREIYDVTKIKSIGANEVLNNKSYLATQSNASNTKISQNEQKSTEKSQKDNKGRTLTKATQDFLVDSKMRDESGNIKTMYHGSPAQFTVFDKKKAKASGYYGKGFYFTESESHAGQYGNKYEVYLNIKNPLQAGTNNITKEQLRKFVEEVSNNEDYGIENYGYDATVDSVTESVYGKDDFAMLQDINATSIGDMVEAVELFNKVNGTNYDGIVATTETVAFYPEQIKSVTNQNPTDNPDINFALSDNNQDIAPTTNGIYGEDIQLERSIAPPVPTTSKTQTRSIAPSMEQIRQAENEAYNELFAPVTEEEANAMLDSEENWERLRSMQEADEMDEIAPPIYSSDTSELTDADLREVRKGIKDTLPLQRGRTKEFNDIVQRYATTEFPNRDALFYEIKDNFGTVTVTEEIADVVEAQKILRTTRINVSDSIKKGVTDYVQTMRRNFGKIRFAKDGMPVDVVYQELSEMYPNMFPEDIANEIDQFEQILNVANMTRTETGEFEIDNGTINETVNRILSSVRDVRQKHIQNVAERRARWFDKDGLLEQYMQTDDYSDLEGNPNLLRVFHERWDRNSIANEPQIDETTAQILESEPQAQKKGFKENIKRKWAVFKANFVDKGAVFEDLAKTTKNRQLEAKWDYTMLAEAQAQYHMQHGDEGVKSLDAIREEVDNTGYSKEFSEYMYHSLNIDRMTLDERYGIENKAVFGNTITAGVSQQKVAELESTHPEFKAYAQDVYDYMSNLRERMVANGIISQETADLWSEMYPHYVPIRRVDSKGLNVNVPLATDRTGVNAPVKRATGGSSDILPLFDTIGQRTMQTFKAINKNDFGIELKNTLGSTVLQENQSVDSAIDMVETQEDLLQAGQNGYNPTFTVFENGERVTFEITQEMYEALLPMSDKMRDSGSKILQKASSFHRGVLTEYNPVFALTNGIKDMQDILMNSQHPAKTYVKIVEATHQLMNKGQWYQEYMKNGGENNSYFDTETNSIAPTKKGILDTFPLKAISDLNNFIERVPRLAEYIASREMGRSVQESMLDSARVTTNFKAGGDVTKFLNRNGVTFLNASVQGATQQVRNVREANMNGLKGWGLLATKFAVAGLPALLLNNLLWDDDDEYEELSDYVKQNYYVVGKYGDGQFIRIPKGRTVAVIQEAFNQMDKLSSGDDSADLNTFLEVMMNNLAPNNPLSNNVIAPLAQAITNKTWYGEDLVPQRLQDSPSAEQYASKIT